MPVGLVSDCWGGTSIETWTPVEGFRLPTSDPQMRDLSRRVDSWNPATEAGRAAYLQYLEKVKEWIPAAEAAVAANASRRPLRNRRSPSRTTASRRISSTPRSRR